MKFFKFLFNIYHGSQKRIVIIGTIWIQTYIAMKKLYVNFTTLVFNYLSKLSAHCKYDDECIQKNHINMKSWIRLHKKAWENPLNDPNENIDSYDAKFVSLVNKCLGKN